MGRKLFAAACFVIVVGLLTGCTVPPRPVALSPTFWQEKSGTIGVALVELPKAEVHMVGPQDPIDKAIADAADARLRQYLATVRPMEFSQLAGQFALRLRAEGFQASVIAEPVSREVYGWLLTKGDSGKVSGNLRALRDKYGVDRLLLLSIDSFGVYRDYFVFVPTAAPLAMFQVRAKLVDLVDERMLWRVAMSDEQNLVPVEGAWDQPPDYPNLAMAMRRAEHDGVVYLENSFFPVPRPAN